MSCNAAPKWVSLKTAADALACHEETMRRMCVEKRVDARLVGGMWRVRLDEEGLPANPEWVSLRAAAATVGCTEEELLAMCTERRVHARLIGGRVWRVRLDADGFPADPPKEERAP